MAIRLTLASLVLCCAQMAWSQENACGEATKNLRARCAEALKEASQVAIPPTLQSSSSMKDVASIQTLQISIQSSKLAAAKDICNRTLAQCRADCSKAAANSNPERNVASAPNGGADPTQPSEAERPDLYLDGTYMGSDLLNKSPAYVAAHKRCLQQGTKPCTTPLVIQLGATSIQMTSKKDGVRFDMRGERSSPVHAPVQISWLTEEARKSVYFLALPNGQNKIRGIDQLFGNNTKGVDGQFADHGWAALAKYDTNHDGKIDRQDPVFSRLRLWGDTNGDGVATPDELHALQTLRVESINLKFSDAKPEVDQYGNQFAMKSHVQLSTGEQKPAFDLIFAP